jgi:AcrR family transcriptional regulator
MRESPEREGRGQARSSRNSLAVRNAAISVLADDGWGALTFSRVGREAGLATSTVLSRAKDTGGLARLAWAEIGSPLIKRLDAICDGVAELRQTGDNRLLVRAWQTLAQQSVNQDAAAELIVVANVVTDAASVVDGELREAMQRWMASEDRAERARVASALGLGLGVMLTNRYPWAHREGIKEALEIRGRALATDIAAGILPAEPADHMRNRQRLADDPALDRLLNATLEEVADRGYDAVTSRSIADAARVEESLIFRRYASKFDLFLDATHRQQTAGFQLNADYMRRIEADHGIALAEAVHLRESLGPGARVGRAMALEQVRLAWHDAKLLRESIDRLLDLREQLLLEPGWGQIETDADFYLNVAAPLGMLLLPRLIEGLQDLPWDVVTKPLVQEMTDQPHRPRTNFPPR